ncbi:MAG: tRNA uridine-5-carboxymethylaminomethyl(34) synthesis GTPase MnmE, partial [Oscillospiraceae bacterium]|nr:tRNA uridine-5-carboxymethylaminomethyl(34) synthesis GTPase MnmE [Oscillospiraceae bacterium]
MIPINADTIAAVSTPAGPGAIGMIRLSGPGALAIAGRVFTPKSGPPLTEREGYAGAYGKIHDKGRGIDDAVAFIYRAPKSYTGEDVAELCCPGGPRA